MADEASRAFLTSMVACLFARGVYTEELLAECLKVVGTAPWRITLTQFPVTSRNCAGRPG